MSIVICRVLFSLYALCAASNLWELKLIVIHFNCKCVRSSEGSHNAELLVATGRLELHPETRNALPVAWQLQHRNHMGRLLPTGSPGSVRNQMHVECQIFYCVWSICVERCSTRVENNSFIYLFILTHKQTIKTLPRKYHFILARGLQFHSQHWIIMKDSFQCE